MAYEGRAPHLRTREFLNSIENYKPFQTYLRLVLDWLIPITDEVRAEVDTAVTDYLNSKVQEYIIIFTVFILFLIGSLVIALKYVIMILKRVVFRSRILIKIIPTSELKRINQIIKNKKRD